jgi:hypothetical protein
VLEITVINLTGDITATRLSDTFQIQMMLVESVECKPLESHELTMNQPTASIRPLAGSLACIPRDAAFLTTREEERGYGQL